jgi:sugar-specific transcriptional regulator TrmB
MDELFKSLMTLGFTQYQARAYLALLQAPRISGYELARRSGIPQSKIYEVADKLIQKELVVGIEEGDVTRYVPLDPARVMARYRLDYGTALDLMEEQLPLLFSGEQGEVTYVLSFAGERDIFAKAIAMIDSAMEEVYLMLWPNELPRLQPALKNADGRGVSIATCVYGSEDPGVGAVYHHEVNERVRSNQHGRRMVLVVDSQEALVAYFSDRGNATAHWSGNVGFVQMGEDYIRHDIWNVRMVQDFGPLIVEKYGVERERLRDVFLSPDRGTEGERGPVPRRPATSR